MNTETEAESMTSEMPEVAEGVQKRNLRVNDDGIYIKSIMTKTLSVPIKYVGGRIHETLTNNLKSSIEGKCDIEGYVKPGSVNIITYSSGLVEGSNAKFTVVFESLICCPVEGQKITCTVKNISRAGISAEVREGKYVPMVVFLARDHNYNNEKYNLSVNDGAGYKEGDELNVTVIASRFQKGEESIYVIAMI